MKAATLQLACIMDHLLTQHVTRISPLTCTLIINITNPRSLIGPTWTNNKFRIVKFVAESIWPVVGCVVNCVSPNLEKVLRVIVVRCEGGRGKSMVEGVRSDVAGSGLFNNLNSYPNWRKLSTHRGIRCRGQGTNPNNCGQLSKKLKICGIKKRRRVFEKWPWIPTTANAIPLK